jgi:hypothetical protein
MQLSKLCKRRCGIVPLTGLVVLLSTSLFMGCSAYTYGTSVSAGVENSTDDVAYLAQYGTWIDLEPYGTVWQPSVSPEWRPFTYGHWMWTDAGWTWVSYEPYGWLVFHYGNWDYDPAIGWFWIEGSEWSAAPVEWLNYDGYASWAPLPLVGREWPEPWADGGLRYWITVRDRDFDRDYVGRYGLDRPPFPRDEDRRDVLHEPLGFRDFEKATGRRIKSEPLRHGPAPVYMHPGHRTEHHEMQPGEVQNEQRQPEQIAHRQAEESPQTIEQPETRHGRRQPETVPPTKSSEVSKSAHENRPEEIRHAENRKEEGERIGLHRMILPDRDKDKVRKYRPQVEREVLVPKEEHARHAGHSAEGKRKEKYNRNRRPFAVE